MHIEVDQSGKIEKMNVDTVLAFSDGKRAAVLIPAEVKRVCLQGLRRGGRRKTTIVLRIFAAQGVWGLQRLSEGRPYTDRREDSGADLIKKDRGGPFGREQSLLKHQDWA